MIFVCIPAYNEEKNIGRLLERIKSSLSDIEPNYEVVVYDDGSDDETIGVVGSFMDSMPIHLIRGEVNKGLRYGMENLILYSLENSNGGDDIAVMLDGDDTHNPSQIPAMVEKIGQGFDVVVSGRFSRGSTVVGVPAYRKILSLGAAALMKTLFPISGVIDYTSGFRAYSVDILRRAVERHGDQLFESEEFACTAELLIKLRGLGMRAAQVPMELRYDRKGGESKMNTGANVLSTLKTIIRLRF
jgi:dolichol-phosphate mannosyltransferase